MNIKISESIHPEIVSLYNSGLSSYKIADRYNVQRKTICDILKKYIKKLRGFNKPCIKDESFFEKIDTQEKAYWLGFLYADGYNSGNGIVLSLQKSDLESIKRFKKDIKSTSNIYTIKREGMAIGAMNKQDLVSLAVSSVKISRDLSKLGCVQKKSLVLQFPASEQVPDSLIHHFIRGFFDGDGCCCISKHNGLFVSFTSNKSFCESLSLYLKNRLNINTYQSKKKNNNSESLYISGFNQIKKFYDFLYEDSTIHMSRKFDKFQKGFLIRNKKLTNNNIML